MATQTNDYFIEDATRSGYIDTQRAKDLLQLYKSYQGQGILKNIGQVAVQHGFLTQDQVQEIQRLRDQEPAARQVGPYEILSKLGAGGMAEVFKARDSRNGQIVALKVLHRRLSEDRDYLQRFYREAQAAAKMHHPHIIRAFEANHTPEGVHYFAMEYVEGTTLKAWLEKSRIIPEREVIKMGVQIAKALDHAQSQGIAHRDIKPDNIMITRDGRIKLTDLGLAKEYSDNRVTEIGIAVGTPQYISPEQARGDSTIDGRSDIYSLGATLFHASTGQPPFAGNSAAIIMVKHMNEAPPFPREINPSLSDSFSHVLLRMLAKDPAQRYQTPKELVRDLSTLYHGMKGTGSPSVSAVVAAQTGTVPSLTTGQPLSGLAQGGAATASTNLKSPAGPKSSTLGARRSQVRSRARQKKKQGGKGKFVFLGICITTFTFLGIVTAIEPEWPKVLLSAFGLAESPVRTNEQAMAPVPVRKQSPAAGKTSPAPGRKQTAQPKRNSGPVSKPEQMETKPAVKSKSNKPAQEKPVGPPKRIELNNSARAYAIEETPPGLSEKTATALKAAEKLVAERRFVEAFHLISGLRDRQKPGATGAFGPEVVVLDQKLQEIRETARPFFKGEVEAVENAVKAGDFVQATVSLESAKRFLVIEDSGNHVDQLRRLEEKIGEQQEEYRDKSYLNLYDHYQQITNMVIKGQYSQAIHFIRTLTAVNPQEAAHWVQCIQNIQDTFEKAEKNAPSLIGSKLRIGAVSGEVVKIRDGRIYLRTQGVELACPFKKLTEKQVLELGGIKMDSRDPDSMAFLGALAFFRNEPAIAKARLGLASSSHRPEVRLKDTILRMSRLTADREAAKLLGVIRAKSKSRDWPAVKEALGQLTAKYSNSSVYISNSDEIAQLRKQMETESLESVFAGRAKRIKKATIDVTFDFQQESQLWDWYHQGNVRTNGTSLEVHGQCWLALRAPVTQIQKTEIRFQVDRFLDSARAFVGWGIFAAAQAVVPTSISEVLPRGYYGQFNSLQGKDSGIWVGGDRPRIAAFSKQLALKPGREYVFEITRTRTGIVWAIDGEIFLKAKNLSPRPGPRVVFFANQVDMRVTQIRVLADFRSRWLADTRSSSERIASKLSSLSRRLKAGQAIPLFDRGLPLVWVTAPDEWKVRNGTTFWFNYYRAPISRLPFVLKDGILEGQFRYAKSNKLKRGFEFAFRETPDSRYAVRFNPPNAEVSLVRYRWESGQELEEIMKQNLGNELPPGMWHKFGIAFRGKHIQVTLHKTQILAYTDAKTVDGTLSLRSVDPGYDGTYSFKDLKLRSLE